MPERAAQLYHALQTALAIHKIQDRAVIIHSALGHSTTITYRKISSMGQMVFEYEWEFDNVGLVQFRSVWSQGEPIDFLIFGAAAGLDLRG